MGLCALGAPLADRVCVCVCVCVCVFKKQTTTTKKTPFLHLQSTQVVNKTFSLLPLPRILTLLLALQLVLYQLYSFWNRQPLGR